MVQRQKGKSIQKWLFAFLLIGALLPASAWSVPEITVSALDNAAIEATDNGQFQISLSEAAAADVTVDYTISGSATSGSDFTSLGTSVTILTGDTSALLDVLVLQDTVIEEDETVIITLDSFTSGDPNVVFGATVTDTVTIADEPDTGTVTISNNGNGSEPSADGQFLVSLSAASSSDTVVSFTVGGTATEGTDYAAIGTSVTIPAGDTSAAIDVAVSDDTIIEDDETVIVTLGAVTSGDPDISVPGSPSATVTITDNESATVALAATIANASEPTADGQFTVTLSGVTGSELTSNTDISFTVTGTAGEGTDYAAIGTSVTIPAGNTSATIAVDVSDDTIIEDAETAIVTLGSVTSGDPDISVSGSPSATVTIADNESATVAIAATTPNGAEPATDGQFTVSLSGVTGSELTSNTDVSFTVSGTATQGTDYTAIGTNVIITAGNTSATIDVAVSDDTIIEDDETVIVTLGSVTSGDPDISVSGSPNATVTITDNESATVALAATIANASEPSADGQFTVSLSGVTGSELTSATDISFTVTGTAGEGTDYAAIGASVTIPAGNTSAAIAVDVTDDTIIEDAETAIVTLGAVTSGDPDISVSGSPSATVTIADNESATVAIAATTANGAEPATDGQFTVSLSGVTGSELTSDTDVSFTVTGTATEGTDYGAIGTSVTILAGDTTATIDVAVNDDTIIEDDETAIVTLGSVTSGDPDISVSGSPSATVTIADNESATVAIAATTPNGAEPATDGQFTVSLSGVTGTELTSDTVISFTVGGTATEGTDYAAIGTSVTILAGNTNATIDVDVSDDTIIEEDETVIVTLSSVTSGDSDISVSGSPNATVTIADNESATVAISATIANGSEPATDGQFTVSLSGVSGSELASNTDISFVVTGTATEGTDYAAIGASVTIPAGDTSATIAVDVADDAIIESDETVIVTLGAVTAGDPAISVVGSPNATVTIADEDTGTVTIANGGDAAEPGTDGAFTVTFSNQADSDTVVSYTVAGTATSGSDYNALSGSITIPALTFNGTIDVLVVDDTIVEIDETVIVTITGTDKAVITTAAPDTATVTIADDGDSSQASIANNGNATEPGTDGSYTVSLSELSNTATVVSYSVDGASTATSGSDYSVLSGSVTIPAMTASAIIDVLVIDDTIVEVDETVIVNITGTDNANITPGAPASATVTIADDGDTSETSVSGSANPAEPATDGSFTVSLSQLSNTDTVVTYTVAGTATPGTDYTALSGTVTIPAMTSSEVIAVPVINEYEVDPGETVIVTLDGATSNGFITSGATDNATVTIIDNDYNLNLEALAEITVNGTGAGVLNHTHVGPAPTSFGNLNAANPAATGSTTVETGSNEAFTATPTAGSCVSDFTGVTRTDGRSSGPVFGSGIGSGAINPVGSQDYDVSATFSPQVQIEVYITPVGNQLTDPAGVSELATWTLYGVESDGSLTTIASGKKSADQAGATPATVTCKFEDVKIVFSGIAGWQQAAPIDVRLTSSSFSTGLLSFTGEYQPLSRLLDLNDSSGTGTGVVELTPEGDLLPNTTYEYLYESNTTVALKATADDGSIFIGWQGDLPTVDADGNPIDLTLDEISFTMDQDRSVTAVFALGCTDNDGDGFKLDPGDGSCTVPDNIFDCNDTNSSIYPGAPESCGDGVDSNCGYINVGGVLQAAPSGEETCGVGDQDVDGDGYTPRNGDCFDSLSTLNGVRGSDIHPGAIDDCNTVNVDEDCFGGPGWEISGTQTENGQWVSGAVWNHVDGNRSCGSELTCEVKAADYPLNTAISPAPPLIMIMFDDSGSMEWQTMTDDTDGAFRIGSRLYYELYDDEDNVGGWREFSSATHKRKWKSQWYSENAMYYNPAVLYQPWPRWHKNYVGVNNGVNDNPPAATLFESSLDDTLTAVLASPNTEILWKEGELVHAHINKPRLNPVDETRFSRSSNSSGSNYRDLSDEPWLTIEVMGAKRSRIKVIRTDDPQLNGTDWEEIDTTLADAVGLDNNATITVTDSPDVAVFDEGDLKSVAGLWINNTTDIGSQSGSSFFHTDINPDPSVGAGSGQTAEWILTIDNEGDYYPYAYWPNFGGGGHTYVPDTNAKYTLSYWDCAGAPTYLEDVVLATDIDQQSNPATWQNLGAGSFRFCQDQPTEEIEISYSHYFIALDASGEVTADEAAISKVYLINIRWDSTNAKFVQEYFEYDDDGDDSVEDGELTQLDSADIPDAIRAKKIDSHGNIVLDASDNPVYMTALEERQAFADWYSFYRRRELAAKGATGLMIETVSGMKVGIYSIHKRAVLGVLPIELVVSDGSTQDYTDQLLRELYVEVYTSQGSTPLRQSYVDVATYFDSSGNKDAGRLGTTDFDNPWGEPGDGGSCQKAYIISMSDGHWNQTANNIGDWDTPSGTYGPYDADIFRDHDYSDDTLADIAMKYYKTDLQPELDDDVPSRGYDIAPHQHIVPYMVAFGVKGDINPNEFPDCLPDASPDDFPLTRYETGDTANADGEYEAKCPDWPDIDNGSSTKEKIDDVYHAAINGRGAYIQADNPQQLVKGLLKIYDMIKAQIATASSVSLNAQKIKTDALLYQTVYQKRDWAGNLFAICLNANGDEVSCTDLSSAPSGGNEIKWTAHDVALLADSSGTWWNQRQVITYRDDTAAGVPFRLASLSNAQKAWLDNDSDLLNYIRGDRSKEGTTFRERVTYYGDFVHSAPVTYATIVVAGSNGGMLHIFEEQTGEEIFSYVPGLIYSKWTDTSATTGTREEKLGTIGDFDYQDNHQFFVDGTVAIKYLGEGNNTTIITGALGKGGKGVFALNVYGLYAKKTAGIENNASNMVLWEYPAPHLDRLSQQTHDNNTPLDPSDDYLALKEIAAADSDPNSAADSYSSSITALSNDPYMGYIFNEPEVVKVPVPVAVDAKGYKWAVVFGNGYESYNQTPVLYVVDAFTGEVMKRIFTTLPANSAQPCANETCTDASDTDCNGLSSPTLVDLDLDGIIDFGYAGDLLGNMWKFDFTGGASGGADAYKVAFEDGSGTPKPLISVRSRYETGQDGLPGMRQPITSKPTVTLPCTRSAEGVMVIFGTGRFIGTNDLNDTSIQSMYGVWDWQENWKLQTGTNASSYYYGTLGFSTTDAATCVSGAQTDCISNCENQCESVETACLDNCAAVYVDPTQLDACNLGCTNERSLCESTCPTDCTSAAGSGYDELTCTTGCYADLETCLSTAASSADQDACHVAFADCDTSCRSYWDSFDSCFNGRRLGNLESFMAPENAKFVTLQEQSQIYFAGVDYYEAGDPEVDGVNIKVGDLKTFTYNPAKFKEYDNIVRILSDNAMDWFNFNEYSSGYPLETKHVGWYFDLPLTGERMVVNPVVLDGVVYYATAIPSSSPCKSGGYSIIMAHESCSGARLPSAVFDLNEDGTLTSRDDLDLFNTGNKFSISGVLYQGIAPAPTITSTLTQDVMFVPGDDPTTTDDDGEEDGDVTDTKPTVHKTIVKGKNLGIYFWRELDW